MKAMILAAGLGTRLKPWTLSHPKALVPVGGVPMLERVIRKLESQGFSKIVVNIHHFGEQIIDFINSKDWCSEILISDERGVLLDTGGGILNASTLLNCDSDPFLIHNVDILSSANLSDLMMRHQQQNNDMTLLVSNRNSSRKLLFGSDMNLVGWVNCSTGDLRRAGGVADSEWLEIEEKVSADQNIISSSVSSFAFSGIHIMNPDAVFGEMNRLQLSGKFPVMDFFLHPQLQLKVKGVVANNLQLLDIGKPETLQQAYRFV